MNTVLSKRTHLATANMALTIFSPSPTHFEVREEALMLKKVEPLWDAIHFPDEQSWKMNYKITITVRVYVLFSPNQNFPLTITLHRRYFSCLNHFTLPIIVFPVPGGPKSRRPLGGPLSPVKMSGRSIGQTTISWGCGEDGEGYRVSNISHYDNQM